MSRETPKNLAASVNARLLAQARQAKQEFRLLLMRYGLERLMYRRETSIAEKSEAMVKLGILISRIKDFYDIWVLSKEFEFAGEALGAAIRDTFRRRSTALVTTVPLALSDSFASDSTKQHQWQAFLKRGRLRISAVSFALVIESNRAFLMPAMTAVAEVRDFNAHWPKGGPWRING